MTSEEWLRAIAAWSPPAKWEGGPTASAVEEYIELAAPLLAERFPPEAFCLATAKRAAFLCETFPNYYWCCRVLEGARP